MSPHSLVECVPNFSEGRRPEVIAQIVAAARAVPGVRVLDTESDADHNRSVVTLVGPPHAITEAAYQMAAAAARLINLDEHHGQHPRMGATDVIPFIPLGDATLADCVALARQVGQRLGDELGIPVYLYEAAATRPERVNLADVRRGEYEGIRAEIDTPARAPDFGPRRVGTAGATAVGARAPLVAYNIYLGTADTSIAKRIAKAVRHSGGGLRYVKALGLDVGGRAQVSMNMTDYTQTPLHRAFEMVRSEAERFGVTLVESEVVGLVPQDARLDAAEHSLRLNGFKREQILERRLGEIPEVSPVAFVDQVAAATPAPGGGSVAALAGSLAAALSQMAAGLTVGRKKYVAVEEQMQAALAEASTLRADLLRLVDEDALAFQRVMAAYRLPKATEAEQTARQTAVQAALVGAAQTPLATAEKAVATLRLLARVARDGNPNARTDAAVGALMAEAATRGAALNVRANVRDIEDGAVAARLEAAIAGLEAEAATLAAEVVTLAR
ncbi:MAG: glutamate formimidoyltransferase [Anaerolineae bacterium]|nr:glutamate formimidoyltransferase [Anaerolineae bacterium]